MQNGTPIEDSGAEFMIAARGSALNDTLLKQAQLDVMGAVSSAVQWMAEYQKGDDVYD
jgi:hypothetical protein